MNIFATSADPAEAARALDDLRLNKMIVESCQILSTVLHRTARGSPGLYKPAYLNHPVVLWAAADPRHYAWLCRHLRALLRERAFRRQPPHKSARLLPLLCRHAHARRRPAEFCNCTPHPELADVHAAYRLTLMEKWRQDRRPPRWTRRGPPAFWIAASADAKREMPARRAAVPKRHPRLRD